VRRALVAVDARSHHSALSLSHPSGALESLVSFLWPLALRARRPLTYAQRMKARGMLADKQGVSSIAEEFECSQAEIQALADAKPKAALSAYMLFGRDHREITATELGTTDPKLVSKALGEKWAAQADRSTWELLAEQDKARFERENALYTASLDAEAEAEQSAKDAAAAGPSEREVERAEKRARMEEDAARRAEKPKGPKKAKVLSADEKALEAQNKAIMGDKEKSTKQRLAFLLGQSDLFKHFGLEEETKAAKKKKGRKTEEEEDKEMASAADDGGSTLEERVRITKQPDLIN
jgi:hypothetical protein